MLRNTNKTYLECRFIAPEQKAAKQMRSSIEMSNAPKGLHDILNIMHDMSSTLKDIGITSRTAEAVRAAKSAVPTVAPVAAFCADDCAAAFDAADPGTFKPSLRHGTVRSNFLASECALVDPARFTTVDALPPLPLHSNLGILCVLQLLQRVIERLEQYLAANNATKVKLIVRCPYRTAAIRTLQQQVQCEIAH